MLLWPTQGLWCRGRPEQGQALQQVPAVQTVWSLGRRAQHTRWPQRCWCRKEAVWSLWQPLPVNRSTGPWDFGVKPCHLCKSLLHFGEQLSACCCPSAEAGCLTMGLQGTMQPELPTTNGCVWPIKPWSWGTHSNTTASGVVYMWLGPSILREEVAQMLVVPTPPTLPSLSQQASVASGQVPMISWQRRRRLGPGSQMGLPHSRHCPEVDSDSASAPLWAPPKGSGEGVLLGHLTAHLAQKWRWPDTWPCIHGLCWYWGTEEEKRAVASGLARWAETWKEHNGKTGNMEIQARGTQKYLSEWYKNVNLFVLHMTAHQREEFNNQGDRVTCSVDPSQPLAPATPVITQGLMNKVVGGMEVYTGSATWTSAQGWPGYGHHLVPNWPAREINTETPGWYRSQGDQPTPWRQTDCTRPLASWKKQHPFLTETHTHLDRSAFSEYNAPAKTPTSGLPECLSHHHGNHTTLLLVKELTSQQKKVLWWTHGTHLSYHVSLTCSSWPEERGEWPSEDSFTVPVRWQYLAGLGGARFSRRLYMLGICIQYMMVFLPQPGFTGPGIQG